MWILLELVGAIWAFIGLGNLIGMPWSTGSEGILMFGIMYNMLLFILPGLIVFGVGAGIKKRRTSIDSAKSEPRQNLESTETKECPYCAEIIKKRAKVCRFCGRDLTLNSAPSEEKKDASILSDEQLMQKYGITFDGEKYCYREYHYSNLSDAINYAEKIQT